MKTFLFVAFTFSVFAGEASRADLLALLSGEWVSRAVYVVAKLDVADHLEHPMSVEELATATKTDPESLGRVLRFLTYFELFEEVKEGVFVRTETGAMLSKSHPETLHTLALFYGEEMHQAWDALVPCVQTGKPAFQLKFEKPVFQYFKENPDRFAFFLDAMKEKSRAVALSALDAYDFGALTSLYDIGGGSGQLLQTILERHSHVQGTLFELPEVTAKVTTDQFSLVPGNFFESLPSGGDGYLLKSILHDWDDEDCKRILDNCYQAMGLDSRLLIMDIILSPETPYASAMDLLMLAVTGGKERSLSAFEKILARSGFVIENVYPTETEFSIIEAKKTHTLATYEASVQEYVSGTPATASDSTKEWIDQTLSMLPKEPRILEIGSAFGRDARYIESQGVQVERTDATQGFIDLLQSEGFTARKLNVLTDPIENSYDLIFANAVFLHFTAPEFKLALQKVHAALSPEGIFAFSVKHGVGEEWSSAKVGRPRFFHYWQAESLRNSLEARGFQVLNISEDSVFLYVIAKPK